MDIEKLVDEMTLAEQISLLSGGDFWSLPAIERLGIGKLRVTDGPNGARGAGSLVGGVTAAAFPVGIALGATWNTDLIYEVGAAIAVEVKTKNAHVSLAPTVNIQRSITNGRNFECYAEDPELASAMAVAYINGLQENGISATIKHFAGNESEIERTTISSEIDERTLREVYLRPFEDAVKKAGTWAIMSSYNKLNGVYAAENAWLLTTVLRDEWGYDGIVMSDWYGSRSTVAPINAGMDLEMPGPTRDRGQKLIDAVEAGEVERETIRKHVLNILRLMERTGALTDTRPFEERAIDLPEHRELIRRAGAEASVLLTNDGILPLDKPTGRIAVIGPNAKTAQTMGGGSAQLNPHYRISPWQGLASRLGEAGLIYAQGCTNHRWEPLIEGHIEVDFYHGRNFDGDVIHSDTLDTTVVHWAPPMAEGKILDYNFSARLRVNYTPSETGIHSFGLHTAGRARLYVDGKLVVNGWDNWQQGRTFFEEGNDEITGQVYLSATKTYEISVEYATKDFANLKVSALRFGVSKPLGDEDIAVAVDVARNAETALVFVGRSGEWDTEGSDLEDIKLPDRQDELVEAVCAVNPNTVVILQTGGPVEMPWVAKPRAILQAWYLGQETGNAIADVLFGDAEPSGRLPQTFPRRFEDNPTHSQDPEVYPGANGKVRYEEGVFIGHRHYDRHGIEPLFAFGHGLGYTQFELGNLDAMHNGVTVQLTAKVRNTGDRAGSTVVQIWVGDMNATVDRPMCELKAFDKLTLDAGEEREIRFVLDQRAFAYCDVDAGQWRVVGGSYAISAGFSAVDIQESVRIKMQPSVLEL